jgi:Na+/glutamate symporter
MIHRCYQLNLDLFVTNSFPKVSNQLPVFIVVRLQGAFGGGKRKNRRKTTTTREGLNFLVNVSCQLLIVCYRLSVVICQLCVVCRVLLVVGCHLLVVGCCLLFVSCQLFLQ